MGNYKKNKFFYSALSLELGTGLLFLQYQLEE